MQYHCGQPLPADARFCPHCGERLTLSIAATLNPRPNLDRFPAVVALALKEYFDEPHTLLKLYRLCDALEIVTRFCTVVAIGELRGLHGGELPESVLGQLRDKVESPTLGKWVGMLRALTREIDRKPIVVPELVGFVRDDLFGLVSGDPRDEEPASPSACFVDLRNHLVHGGAISLAYAETMLRGGDGFEGWAAKLDRLLPRLDFWSTTRLCWFDGDRARLLGTDNRLGEDVPLSADLRLALTRKNLPYHVVLIRDGRWVDLWPLTLYAEPRLPRLGGSRGPYPPASLLFVRAEENRLLYAALGAELPYGESSAESLLSGFARLFRREARKKEQVEFDYDDEAKRDAARVVGRGAEFKRIKQAINATDSGVLWLSGPGGMGKSLLMSKVALNLPNDRATGECLVVFWRFRASDASRCNSHAFFRHAVSRLCQWKPLDSAYIRPSADPARLQGQLFDLLGKVAALTPPEPPGRVPRVILMLDGLDEIARSKPSFLEVPFGWPLANVVWVCAGRADEATARAFRPDRPGCAAIYPDGLPAMADADVRAMLLDQHGKAKYDFLRLADREKEELVAAIVRKSEGLPLYVHFLLEDIQAGEKRFDAGLLHRLPEGLSRYYLELVSRFQLSALAGLLPPLTATIAWSEEPLDESALLEFMRRREAVSVLDAASARSRLREGLAAMGGIVRGVLRRDGKFGYEPYHLTFREYYRRDPDRVILDQNDNARAAFGKWAIEWNGFERVSTAREYLLRHGPQQLLDLDQAEALYELGRSEAFLTAQADELVREPQSPLRTLMTALLAACRRDDAASMADFTLRHAQRKAEINQESPLQTMRKGNLDRAIALCEQLEPNRQLLALLLLLWESLHQGRDFDADRVYCLLQSGSWPRLQDFDLERAVVVCLGAILRKRDVTKGHLIFQCLHEWSREKLISQSLEQRLFSSVQPLTGAIENSTDKATAFSQLSSELARAGRASEALGIARSIPAATARSKALSEVAAGLAGLARANEARAAFDEARAAFDEAHHVAQSVPRSLDRSSSLGIGLAGPASLGQYDELNEAFDQARRVAQSVPNNSAQSKASSRVAASLAGAKQIDETHLTARSSRPDDAPWSAALREVAAGLAGLGRNDEAHAAFDEALRVARGILSASNRVEALSGVAAGLASLGRFDEAHDAFEEAHSATWRIPSDYGRSSALNEIAVGLAGLGQHDKARVAFGESFRVARGIPTARDRSSALSGVAARLAEAGQADEARAAFDESLLVAGGDHLDQALGRVAVELARSGRADEALGVVRRIPTDVLRTFASSRVAAEVAGGALADEAVRAVRGIRIAAHRWPVLTGVASELARAGRASEALGVARSIPDTSAQSKALAQVAAELGLTEQADQARAVFDEALRVVQSIPSDPARSAGLDRVVAGLARAGRIDEAHHVARGIPDASARSKALSGVAAGLAGLARADEAHAAFDEALRVARNIPLSSHQSEALSRVAAELERAGRIDEARAVFDEAIKIARTIHSKMGVGPLSGSVVWLIGLAHDLDSWLPRIAEVLVSILTDRHEHFAAIASAFAQRGHRAGLKLILPLCADRLKSAIDAVAGLIRVYPDQAASIYKVFEEHRLSAQASSDSEPPLT